MQYAQELSIAVAAGRRAAEVCRNVPRAIPAAMEKQEQSFDYLLFAKITSGTTRSNQKDYQRDYLLTLELINMESGHADKESAELRKGYHKSRLGKFKHYGAG